MSQSAPVLRDIDIHPKFTPSLCGKVFEDFLPKDLDTSDDMWKIETCCSKCKAPYFCHPSKTHHSSCENKRNSDGIFPISSLTTGGNCADCLGMGVVCKPSAHPIEGPLLKKNKPEYQSTEVYIEFDRTEENYLILTFHPDLLKLVTSRYYGIRNPLKLYNRQVYPYFYRTLLEDFEAVPVLVISGTPGIGKSYYQFFLLYYFLRSFKLSQNNKSFCFSYYAEQYIYLEYTKVEGNTEINEKVRYYFNLTRIKDDDMKLMELKENIFVCFYDHLDQEKTKKFPFNKNIILSSPNPNRFAEFSNHGSRSPFYMPIWEKHELEYISDTLDTNWSQNFDFCGGIPRTLILPQSDIIRRIQNAIKAKGNNTTSLIMLSHSTVGIQDISHVLAFPVPSDTFFKNFEYILPTQYIIAQLKDKFDKHILEKAMKLISTGAYKQIINPGRLFEDLILTKIRPFPGQRITFKSFTGADPISYDFPSESKSFTYHDFKNTLYTFHPEVFYYAQSKTQESIDAFSFQQRTSNPSKYDIYFFQVTIAETHPVKFNGLDQIIKEISAGKKQFNSQFL